MKKSRPRLCSYIVALVSISTQSMVIILVCLLHPLWCCPFLTHFRRHLNPRGPKQEWENQRNQTGLPESKAGEPCANITVTAIKRSLSLSFLFSAQTSSFELFWRCTWRESIFVFEKIAGCWDECQPVVLEGWTVSFQAPFTPLESELLRVWSGDLLCNKVCWIVLSHWH